MKLNKNVSQFIIILLMSGFVFGCGNQGEEEDTSMTAPVELTESDLENFIIVLPDVLEFSEKFQSVLDPQRLASAEYNDDFYKAISVNQDLKKVITNTGFESIDEYIEIHKNITLAYDSLKTEFDNFSNQIKLVLDMLDYDIQELKTLIKNPSVTDEKRLVLQESLTIKKYQKIYYNNVKMVYKYEDEIDEITTGLE